MSILDKKVDRKGFFKLSFLKSVETIEKKIDKKIARICVRPPNAISEKEFLLKCTHCEECKDACDYDVIHIIDKEKGGIYGGTPFIDIYHKPCNYCNTFDCMKACEEGCFEFVEDEKPILGKAEFVEEHCLVKQGQYCDYCFKTCPEGINAIAKGEDKMPVINFDKCVGCGNCAYMCVSQTGKAIVLYPA